MPETESKVLTSTGTTSKATNRFVQNQRKPTINLGSHWACHDNIQIVLQDRCCGSGDDPFMRKLSRSRRGFAILVPILTQKAHRLGFPWFSLMESLLQSLPFNLGHLKDGRSRHLAARLSHSHQALSLMISGFFSD